MKGTYGTPRIWMYQLNPAKGRQFKFRGRLVPTTAENLLAMLTREGPVQGPWYITKNFRVAKSGDRIIVRVNQGRRGAKIGLVGSGSIEKIEKNGAREANLWIRFDMRQTRRLMKSPIPIEVVRSVIPKDQNNIGDITLYKKQISKWLNGTITSPQLSGFQRTHGWVEFTPAKKPGRRRTAQFAASPEETAQLNEQANRRHRELLVRLSDRLRERGCSDVQQIRGAVDLAGTYRRHRLLFEAKTITRKNQNHQSRLGLAQLFEYRFKYGTNRDVLCLLTDRVLSKERATFLDSLGIAVMWPRGANYAGNATARKMMQGLVR